MKQKRVHLRSAVNAANVSKKDGVYTIKDVCCAVDEIVMNSVLYGANELAASASTLNGKPAPAGHPKNAAGQAISALSVEGMLNNYFGAMCTNSRHEGGRTLTDILINEAQARVHSKGAKVADRLEAAINGSNVDPIHVSTGLMYLPIETNGESRGKKYARKATQINYDHLAVLVDEQGAGTPADGVGMFLNEAGEAIEELTLNTEPEDKRSTGLKAWVLRLIGNGTEVSFDQISSGLYAHLPADAWIRDVYDRYAIWTDRDGKYWRQDYSVSSDGSVAFSGQAVEVVREVTYQPITNHEDDQVKETIIAALNAAGISGVAAMTDAQLLGAFEALKAKPHLDALNTATEKLTAANSKIAEHEATALAAQNAERDALATELAVNSSLTVDDLKALGLDRLKALKAKAAPVVVGNSGAPAPAAAGDYKPYDLNSLIDAKG